MKKIFLSAFSIVTFTVLAQAQVKVGMKAGGSLSTQRRSDANTTNLLSTHSFRGYQAGLVADVKLTDHLYLQPQVLYALKGAKYKTFYGVNTKLSMQNIEMPLNVLYKKDMSFGKLFAGGGPVVSYGFAGKVEQNGNTQKLYKTINKNWKRTEISANMVAGLEFDNGFFGSINYQRGFQDLYKTNSANVKNNSVSLTIGYFLDGGK